jgi:hypothetical protein
MNDKSILISTKSLRKWAQTLLVISLMAVLLTACAQATATPSPETPSPEPVLQPTPAPTEADAYLATSAATFVLAEHLNIGEDQVQIVDAQPVQWPDSCLGVPQSGIMCAMHVVDGYRITLSANGQTYEVHSNLDGSQTVLVPGPVPASAGISYTVNKDNQCQAFQFNQGQDVAVGPCDGILKQVPYSQSIQRDELNYFVLTYQSFSTDTPNGFLVFSGKGQLRASGVEQRSILTWAQIAADGVQAGRSSAAEGVLISWHREGGVAGFCDNLSVYETGVVSASSCKNGQSVDLGQTWLDSDQLTQIYQWMDNLSRFEYTDQTTAAADGMTINLVFAGQGSTTATASDQQAIETFAEGLFAQVSDTGTSLASSEATKVVSDFLTTLQADPSGKSSMDYLSNTLQADIQMGNLLPNLLGIQNTYSSFGISSSQEIPGTGQILVEAGLNYVSPIKRAFVLINENDTWKINTFIVYAFPSVGAGNDFTSADQVILEYVQALQNKDAVTAWDLLSQNGQSGTSQAALEKEAQGLQFISPVSIILHESGSDRLTYTVNLWVELGQNVLPGWKQGLNSRSFELIQTKEGWRINQISANQ